MSNEKNQKTTEEIKHIKINIDNNEIFEDENNENIKLDIKKKIKSDNAEKPKILLDNSKAKVKESNSLNLNKSNTASKNPSHELKEYAKVNTSIIEIKQQKSKLSNEKNKSSGKCEISKNYVQNVNLKKYYYFYAVINEEYFKKIQISLKNPNENIIPDSIAHYDYSDNFCDKKGKK